MATRELLVSCVSRVGGDKNCFVTTEISGMLCNITPLPEHPAVKAYSSLGGT
jgi:hypothetical protein